MDNELHLIYDEEEAIQFIRKFLPQQLNDKLKDADIDYIIEKLYGYYEEVGMFEDNMDEKTIIDIDEEELTSYVVNTIRQEDETYQFTSDEILLIIQAELGYCDYIGVFE